jgi:hypothetical protein
MTAGVATEVLIEELVRGQIIQNVEPTRFSQFIGSYRVMREDNVMTTSYAELRQANLKNMRLLMVLFSW